MDQHRIPTFFMGRNGSIDNEGKVLLLSYEDKLHALHNEATLRAVSAIVDDEMTDVRDYFASETAGLFYVIGDGDEPLIARMWRTRVFVWSFKNNMWQLAESHTDVKAWTTAKGSHCVAHTPVGEAFLKHTESK